MARKSSFPTQDPGVLECRVRWVSLGRDHLSRAYQFWRHTKPILGATKVKKVETMLPIPYNMQPT